MKPAGKTTVRRQLAAAKKQLAKNKSYDKNLEEDIRSLQSKLEKSTKKYRVLITVCCIALFFLLLYWSDGMLLTRSSAEKEISAAFSSGFSEGKKTGIEEGRELGHSEGYQDAEEEYGSSYKDGYEEGRMDGLQEAYDEYEGLPDRAEEYKECIAYLIELLDSYEEDWIDLYEGPYLGYWPSVSDFDTPSSPAITPTPTPSANMVWIPTNGGKRYHRTSGCSGMDDPQQVTLEEAESMGFGPCGRCY